MGILDKLRGKAGGSEPTTVLFNGGRVVRAVGESNYQPAYEKLCGPKTEDGHVQRLTVTLTPEPNNQYDPNAVAVTIEGHKLAHLAKAQAKEYQPLLLELARKGIEAQCAAVIRGGWIRGSDEGSYGLVLALSEPKRCYPPTGAMQWEGPDDEERLEWLRLFRDPTGQWSCARCGKVWSDSTPVPSTWTLQKEGPHVCGDCGSYAFTFPA